MEIAEQLEKAECECRKRLEKVQEIEKQLEKAKLAHERACSKLNKLKEAQQIQDSRNSIVSDETLDQLVNEKFVWSNKLKTVLNKTFRFENFRSKQLAVINATLSKKDVILVMPTGGGKSLVYQLPALVDEGFTVVVCPLISLMEDQLMAAKKFNIPAVALNSTIPKAEVKQIQEQMTQTNVPFKLIYVTPEWVAKNKRFMKALKTAYESNKIARVAIGKSLKARFQLRCKSPIKAACEYDTCEVSICNQSIGGIEYRIVKTVSDKKVYRYIDTPSTENLDTYIDTYPCVL